MSTKFSIPKSATKLREIPSSQLDLRPDAEIITELKIFCPVTSEKNVWAFWDKGYDSIYPTHQVTILNWVRRLGPSWTVRIVDLVHGSPNNIYNFVDRSWFPECFNNWTMDGRHAAQHAADLVRLPLVYTHGGAWMDVSNMLHTHLDALFWDHLTAVPANTNANAHAPYEVALWDISGQIRKAPGSFGNFMLAARKGCAFIKNWHEGYLALWRGGRTSVRGFHATPLMREIGLADGMADWGGSAEHKNIVYMSNYVSQMLVGEHLRRLFDVFLVEGIRNGNLGAIQTGFDGMKQAQLFLTPLDESDAEKRKKAEDFVVQMLENSHMYKVYHNSAEDDNIALGDLVKREGFMDLAHRPGTFGEMYRYGTVHWESTRGVERLEPWKNVETLIRATPTQAAVELGEDK